MKLIIAYLPYNDPQTIVTLGSQVSPLSFSECSGIDSDVNNMGSVRVEKFCEDSEVDFVINAIKSANGWAPPNPPPLPEEEKQALLDKGFTEEDLKPVDAVRPNGENLGKIFVLDVTSTHRVYDA